MLADPTFVLIDVQKAFCDPAHNESLADDPAATARIEHAIQQANDFLDRYRESGRSPIVVRAEHDEFLLPSGLEEASDRGKAPPPCLPGTEQAAFADSLDVESDDLTFTKPRYDAFFGTPLAAYLTRNDVSEIYMAGVNTHICVLSTAFSGICRNFGVTVLSDCCAASSEEAHEAGLSILSTVADGVEKSEEVSLPPM